jgi:hypothetical protein
MLCQSFAEKICGRWTAEAEIRRLSRVLDLRPIVGQGLKCAVIGQIRGDLAYNGNDRGSGGPPRGVGFDR